MGFSVKQGVYLNRDDLLAKAQAFLGSNGWTVLTQNPSYSDSNYSFGLFSNGTGQITTKNIVPGEESIYILFTKHSVDGLNQAKMHRPITVTRTGTLYIPGSERGMIGAGETTPPELGAFVNDSSPGTFIFNTDGTPSENGTWVGIHTTSSVGVGLYSFQGAWSLPSGIKRNIETINSANPFSGDIEIAGDVPEDWQPENFGTVGLSLELAKYGSPTEGDLFKVTTVGTTQEASPGQFVVSGSFSIAIGAGDKISEWIFPRAIMDTSSVQSSNAYYFKPAVETPGTLCSQGAMTIAGSDPSEGDPNEPNQTFEASLITMHDSTEGIVLHVNPSSALAVPRGALVADVDKINFPSVTDDSRVIYDARSTSPLDEFYWLVRTR